MNLGSQRIMKMGCVVREPLSYLAAQPRETVFSRENLISLVGLDTLPTAAVAGTMLVINIEDRR
jgi:hypothetical protein